MGPALVTAPSISVPANAHLGCAGCETCNTVGAVLGAESSCVLGLGGTAWPGGWLMTELGGRGPHHQGATSRPRIFFFGSSCSLWLAVGVCRSRRAEQALRFDRVAAATT